jgi:hypothetical protein
MKIYEGQGPIYQKTTKKQIDKSANGSEFQKVMDQITPSSGQKGAVSGKECLSQVANGIRITNGIEAVKNPGFSDRKSQILNELQNTLDLVDFYAEKLGDSSISANGLSPLVEHIEDRMEGLRNSGASSETPEKLKSIIADMTITIGSEIERFKRGDYS